jgi:hypothetical protein
VTARPPHTSTASYVPWLHGSIGAGEYIDGMVRIAFLIYCLLAWGTFLFQPLLSINLLLAGFVVFGWYRERR